MNELRNHPRLISAVKTLMLIDLALIMGVLMAAGVLMFVRSSQTAGQPAEFATPLITYVAAGVGAMTLLMSFVLPGSMDSAFRQKLKASAVRTDDPVPFLNAYFIRNIVVAAMLEGGAFFNVIGFFIEGRPLSLVATGLLLAVMGMQMPNTDRAAGWIERQRRHIQSE
ncbi:MAG: hypothetical protein KF841_05320 [Phycisphaerae bacterium]|nr:hypothetical protein [Phycisphaerae bacterium]